MNIFQRIAKVQKAISKVAKDTTVKAGGGSYKAVSHDAVLSVIRDAVIEAGIIVAPTQVGKGEVIPGQTNSGTYKHRFEAVYRIDFINIENPDDRYSVEIEAHADDNGDKAPGKAISYATKTAELKVFMIATGENDEERMEDGHYGQRQQPPTKPTPKEPTQLTADHERVKMALKRLFGDDKKSALDKVEEMTTFKGRDRNMVTGVRDFTTISGKRLEILADKLEKLSAEKRAEPDPGICAFCGTDYVDGHCPSCDPF